MTQQNKRDTLNTVLMASTSVIALEGVFASPLLSVLNPKYRRFVELGVLAGNGLHFRKELGRHDTKHPKVNAHQQTPAAYAHTKSLTSLAIIAGGVFGLRYAPDSFRLGVGVASIAGLSYMNSRNRGVSPTKAVGALAIAGAAAMAVHRSDNISKGLESLVSHYNFNGHDGKMTKMAALFKKGASSGAITSDVLHGAVAGLAFAGVAAVANKVLSGSSSSGSQFDAPPNNSSNIDRAPQGPQFKPIHQPTKVSLTSRIS